MPAFFEKLDKIKPAYDAVYKVTLILCKLLLIADILIVSYQVLSRYVSFIPSQTWCEEIVLALMSYMAVISAALAIRKNSHIRIQVFDRYLPETLIRVLDILADVAVMALGVIMIIYGWQYAQAIGAQGSFVSLPWLSRFWKYLPVCIAGIAMVVFEIEALYNHVKIFFVEEEPEKEEGGEA